MKFNKEKMHDISYALFWVGLTGHIVCNSWIHNSTLNSICIVIEFVFLIIAILTAQKPLKEFKQLAIVVIIMIVIVFGFDAFLSLIGK